MQLVKRISVSDWQYKSNSSSRRFPHPTLLLLTPIIAAVCQGNKAAERHHDKNEEYERKCNFLTLEEKLILWDSLDGFQHEVLYEKILASWGGLKKKMKS